MNGAPGNIAASLSGEQLDQIAGRVRHLRTEILKMSQPQFAALTGISQTYLSLVETGKSRISSKALLRICAAANVNEKWLVYGDESSGILVSPDVSRDRLVQMERAKSLAGLRKAYSLNKSETAFLEGYLALSRRDREKLAAALKAIRELP